MTFSDDVNPASREQSASEKLADAWDEGVRLYAWWFDGVEHVGTTGRLLKDALAENPFREKSGQ